MIPHFCSPRTISAVYMCYNVVFTVVPCTASGGPSLRLIERNRCHEQYLRNRVYEYLVQSGQEFHLPDRSPHA